MRGNANEKKGTKLVVSCLLCYFVPAGLGGVGAGLFRAKRLAIIANCSSFNFEVAFNIWVKKATSLSSAGQPILSPGVFNAAPAGLIWLSAKTVPLASKTNQNRKPDFSPPNLVNASVEPGFSRFFFSGCSNTSKCAIT